MLVQFKTQALVGSHVYSPGERGAVDDHRAADLIQSGAAVEYVEPAPDPVVREAVASEPQRARKAVNRGG